MQEPEVQNIDNVIRDVIRILLFFLRQTNGVTTADSVYRHFDIVLSRIDDVSFIQVTNCDQSGKNFHGILQVFFDHSSTRINGESCIQEVMLFIKHGPYKKEFVYELRNDENKFEMIAVMTNERSEHLRNLKKYFSVRLKCKLSSSSNEIFIKSFIEDLEKFTMWHSNVKCTFHSGKEMYWRNKIELDKPIGNCKLVSHAITEMIKKTNNIKLRKRFLELFTIDKVSKIEDALTNKFIILIREEHKNIEINNYSLRSKRMKRD